MTGRAGFPREVTSVQFEKDLWSPHCGWRLAMVL